jgi:hypothetical protein
MCGCCDSQPPLDDSFEPGLQPTTLDNVLKLRQPPRRTRFERSVRLLMFIVIGIPRSLIAGSYGFVMTVVYESIVTFWTFVGAPEVLRFPLQVLWYIFCRIFLFLLGVVRIRYHGKCNPRARFLVSNHLCFLDRWLFWWLWPNPLDKKELLELPAGKAVLDVFRGILVDSSKSCGLTNYILQRLRPDDE